MYSIFLTIVLIFHNTLYVNLINQMIINDIEVIYN